MTMSSAPNPRSRFKLSEDNKPIAISAGFILVILAVGTAYTLTPQGTATLLSPEYLLQQLQVGAFLGIAAAGMMLVILLGHIDLSIPWTIAAAAMMATTVGGPMAIPVGLAVGLLGGFVNGLGVAYLRIPSMIFTLGVNAVMRGLMVAHTGGFAPQTAATDLLVSDIEWMVAQWEDGGAAREELMADPTAGLSAMLTGMGSLSYGETAGERMRLGVMLNDPEEEHSCFADNTHNDHFYNGVGIQSVYLGSYTRIDGSVVGGPSLSGLVAATDADHGHDAP